MAARLCEYGWARIMNPFSCSFGQVIQPLMAKTWRHWRCARDSNQGCRGNKNASLEPRAYPMDWAKHGVKIVHADELDLNTPQTSGMTRAAAITHAKAGASKLWAGTLVVQPDAKTGPHHHGELETVLYVVKGRARMRWGDRLELSDEAGAG